MFNNQMGSEVRAKIIIKKLKNSLFFLFLLQQIVVDHVGRLRRQFPQEYTHADTHTYKVALEEDGVAAATTPLLTPLFGTIPALRAVAQVVEKDLKISFDKVRTKCSEFDMAFLHLIQSGNVIRFLYTITG